jgi:hypothetical protein
MGFLLGICLGFRLLKVDWDSFQKSNCCGLIGTTGNMMCAQVNCYVARHAVAKFVKIPTQPATLSARKTGAESSEAREDLEKLSRKLEGTLEEE